MKACTKCGERKPLDDFHRDRTTKDGRASRCKACAIARAREWYRANPERARAAQRSYTERNRAKVNADQRARAKRNPGNARAVKLKSRYGISVEEYHERHAAQDGRCAICRREAELHVDHDHEDGRPRGLLCPSCNRGIGQLGDDPERVRAALRYLLEWATR